MGRSRVRTIAAGTAMMVGVATLGSLAATPAQAAGATYTVDRVSLCRNSQTPAGGTTFEEALAKANSNPGKDTIVFQPGLGSVSVSPCYGKLPGFPFGTRATESVDIIGNQDRGVTIEGNQLWLDSSGRANDPQVCPSQGAGAQWVQYSTGFLQVGTYDADNSGVTVTLAGFEFHNLPSLIKVEKSASLILTDSMASEVNSFLGSCERPAIQAADEGADITLRRVQIDHSSAPGARTGEADVDALIAGGNGGNLVLDEVLFAENWQGRAVSWFGPSATIVSSRFPDTGGLYLSSDRTQVVNSAFYSGAGRHAGSDRIYAANGRVDVTASSFYWDDPNCSSCSLPGQGFLTSGAGAFNFQATAVGAASDIYGGGPLIYDDPTAFTSDSRTWVQTTPNQNGAALRAILPNVLTDPPGLTAAAVPGDFYETTLTPLLGTQASPGVLIDAVPDADPGQANELKNPIDGTPITADVFGTPRVADNGTRNIGAVQLSYSPRLSVVDADKRSVTVAWTRPLDPPSGPITGYQVFYRAQGSGSAFSKVAVSGATTLSKTIAGLTPDAAYEFYVVGVNVSGDGPRSNTVVGRTLPDPHLSYPQGAGRVGDPISPLVPHLLDVTQPRSFFLAKGELPPGLKLDTASGDIGGTPTKSGTWVVTVVVAGANGTTADTEVTITVKDGPLSPALSYPEGKGEQGQRLDPLVPHPSGLTGTLRYQLVSGSLPSGVRLNGSTGTITGKPGQSGTFRAKIKVTGEEGSATSDVTLRIRKPATPSTSLKVTARGQRKSLPVGSATKVVKRIKSSGRVAVKTRCEVNGVRVGKYCRTTVTKNRSVTVTPLCNDRVTYTVRITAKATGAVRTTWQRTWAVKKAPATPCRARGRG